MIKKVFGSNVVIKLQEVEEKTASGIIMPTAKGQKQQFGVVVAVGEGHILDDGTVKPLEAKVGDTVIFAKYAGTKIQVEGIDYLVVNERDILVKIG